MREIVLDTETTGIDSAQGHRIIEIGALEISIRHRPARSCISTSIPNARLRPVRWKFMG